MFPRKNKLGVDQVILGVTRFRKTSRDFQVRIINRKPGLGHSLGELWLVFAEKVGVDVGVEDGPVSTTVIHGVLVS